MFKRIRNRYQYSNSWKRRGVLKTIKEPALVITGAGKNMDRKITVPEIHPGKG